MWVLAAQFGLSLLQGQQAAKQTKTQNKLAKFNAGIQDQLTQASNQVAAASGALARFRQSLGNQLILKNAGKQTDALATNLFRLQEQSQTAQLNTRIQAAEQTGSLMAAAASAGIGGSTIDRLNNVIKGREARNLEQQQRAEGYAAEDTFNRIRAVKDQAITGLDDQVYLDRVTQVKAVPGQVGVPGWGSQVGTALLSTLGTQAGIDAVSKFGAGVKDFFKSDAPSGANLQIGGFNPVTGNEATIDMPSSWFKG